MKLVKTSARSFTVRLTSMLPGLPYPNGTHEMKKDLQIIEHTQNHHDYIAELDKVGISLRFLGMKSIHQFMRFIIDFVVTCFIHHYEKSMQKTSALFVVLLIGLVEIDQSQLLEAAYHHSLCHSPIQN